MSDDVFMDNSSVIRICPFHNSKKDENTPLALGEFFTGQVDSLGKYLWFVVMNTA
jgi:hypothetical protein